MRDANSELKVLRKHWPEAELVGEGERKFVLLPSFVVNSNGQPNVITALLQPFANGDGYLTRLYFSEKFSSKGSNWNIFNILGRSWHARSWNGVSEDLPWLEIISNHLRDLQ